MKRILVEGFFGRVLDPHICHGGVISVGPMAGDSAGLSTQGYADFGGPDYTPVVPDATGIDLAGQFMSMPGGYNANGSTIAADGAGINQVYMHPAVNPTPTGGWMTLANSVIGLAQQSMKTFTGGSPSPAIPAAQRPLGPPSVFTNAAGQTNWLLVGGIVVVGVGAMVALAMWV
jgi:hypothetical protein